MGFKSPPAAGAGRLASVTVSPMRASRHGLSWRRQNRLAGFEFFKRDGLRRERAELFKTRNLVVVDEANFHVIRDAPFITAHEDDGAAVNVEHT